MSPPALSDVKRVCDAELLGVYFRHHIIMRLRSVCPSLSGKNGLRDENEKGMTGCGSGMRLSWSCLLYTSDAADE